MTVTLLLNPLFTPEGVETEGGPFDRHKQKFMIEWSYVPEDNEGENDVSVIVSFFRK